MGPQTFMNYGLQMLMGLQTYELSAENINLSANFYELWAPNINGWMNGVLGHFYALSRMNWAGDNLG